MDWYQTLTIIGSTIGASYIFYHITDKRIDRMDEHHREDMKQIREANKEMDLKWERLFERLLIQDQQRGK